MSRQHILCVIGTRPEAIKMAPVVLELQKRPEHFQTTVLATAQHREMLDQVLDIFAIRPDIDLDLMTHNQTLTAITCRVLGSLEDFFKRHRVDVLLAQGDTTTAMASAVACFYHRIPFGHVEAGLRTGNLQAPFPEEFNRRVAALATCHHFAPTEHARQALLSERIDPATIHVTGNTVVDALHHILRHTQPAPTPVPAGRRYVLMTCHRRESFGEPLRGIFQTVRAFAQRHPDLVIWYPVHPNPNVTGPAHEILGGLPNVLLTKPVDYVTFLHAMTTCHFLLTDSGGIQEEAATLGKPVLVLREVTERPEGVEAGVSRLVGVQPEVIADALEELLTRPAVYERMSKGRGVFGDGTAARRIADVLAS